MSEVEKQVKAVGIIKQEMKAYAGAKADLEQRALNTLRRLETLGYRPVPEGDDEGLVNLGEAAGDLFFPKYLGLRADELEVIMRWAADFGNRARKAQKALTESKYEPVQLEVLGELKKKYLRAVWKSIKKGAGDCSIPQDYLVFMIPSDEWQILEATNKANEDKLGQLYRRKDEG